jgi:hypothetical protein
MFIKKILITTIISAIFLFSVDGCIPIDDLGDYWEKGIIDSDIEGHWKFLGNEYRSQDTYISFTKSEDHYLQESNNVDFPEDAPNIGLYTKTLVLGKYKFLIYDVEQYYKDLHIESLETASKMAKEEGQEINQQELQEIRPEQPPFKGGIQRYEVKDGVLVFYALDEQVLSKAIEKGQVKGTLPKKDERGVAKLSKLDNETIQFIIQSVNDPNKWKQANQYERVKNLQEALKKSKTYPSTEDTLENTEVNINLPDLKYFAENKMHILLYHLQASPEWKVFIHGQRMICHRREWKYGRWNETGIEYLDEDSRSEDNWFPIDDLDRTAPMNERNWQQMKYLFRFEKEPFGYHATWAKASHVMKVNPLAGRINLKLSSSDQGIESYIAIGQPNLWFECFEQTWHEPRKKTHNALKLLQKLLRGVRESEKEIEENGYASKLLPSGSVRNGKPTIEVKFNYNNNDYFDYTVNTWVNSGTQGYVYLKVFNLTTKKYLSEKQMGWPKKEYIGWSKNHNSLFLYNTRIGIRSKTLILPFDAQFELWFCPSNDGSEKKLIETTCNISG